MFYVVSPVLACAFSFVFRVGPNIFNFHVSRLFSLAVLNSSHRRCMSPLSALTPFLLWTSVHNVTYPTAEEHAFREKVWEKNAEMVKEMNKEGKTVFEMNGFGDLTQEEFEAR